MVINKDWKTILDKASNRRFNDAYAWFYRSVFSLTGRPEGLDVMSQDWDYLIILDACRHDVFKEVNWLDGSLTKVKSRASNSVEFMNRNFTEYYYNTVQVTANPFMSPHPSSARYQSSKFKSDEHFPHVNQVYLKDRYSEGGVTKPEAMTKEAIKTHERFPDSRMIVHYMQPHKPFIADHRHLSDTGLEAPMYEDMLDAGLTWNEIREVYKANLRRALDSVEDLVQELDGDIVVTSDHGEMLGEYGLHSHPPKLKFDELLHVPWFEVEN